jgi:uncharacterized protein (TIGR02145 family)
LNGTEFIVKIGPFGSLAPGARSIRQAPSTAAETIDDVVLCTKDGYSLGRAVVTSSEATGIQITMTPLVTGTVSDYEGNSYATVKIGNQVWTTENLRSTKYNDGSSIGSNYTFYKDITDKKKWGALYNFTAASNAKLAPTGWRVPTEADWDTLVSYLIKNGYNDDGTTTENRIAKALAAKTDWKACTEPGALSFHPEFNNSTGFSALPSGYRLYDGTFYDLNVLSCYWSSTQYDASYGYYHVLMYTNFDLSESYRVKTMACAIRLIKKP